MDEQTLAILFFGSLVVAFAFFSSYMAQRQKDQDEKEAKVKTDLVESLGRFDPKRHGGEVMAVAPVGREFASSEYER